MLYRVAFLALVGQAAAQECEGQFAADAGTAACACEGVPCAIVTDMGTPVTLTTTLGPVTGRVQDGIERYFGVPVAASSAGSNRFKPPQATSWTTAVETTVEHICPLYQYGTRGTEDCIAVDVMKPSGYTNIPAGFWIHGGGFTTENPFFNNLVWGPHQNYNYPHLPSGGKIVTVLAHYRLGALGWMAHPGFGGDAFGSFGTTMAGGGNFGMMDAIHEIKWVSDNAANLGVDATKITVFGESAGAAHVTMLMASPLTVGMVATFIAQSPFISYGAGTFSVTARQEMGTLFTLRSGCATTADVASGSTATTEAACLRSARIQYLISDTGFNVAGFSNVSTAIFDAKYGEMAAALFTYNSIHVWPVVDGLLLTMPPLEAYASGNNAAATMVVGHNSDEYTTFCYSPPFAGIFGEWACGTAPDVWNQAWIIGMYYLDKTATYSQIYAAVMTADSGTKMNQLKAGLFYSDIKSYDGGVAQLGVQMGTDAWFANGNKQVLEALMSAPGRAAGTVYHYVFGGLTDPEMYLMGACHGCELTYVLGFYQRQMTFLSSQTPASMGLQTVVPSGGSNLVGNAMNSYWSSLWWYGTPNTAGSGLPQWVPMAGNDKQTMTFSIDYATGALMNPCVRFTTCRTEPTKDWRYAQKQFWGSSPTDIPVAMPACTSAPAAQVTLPEAKTGIACNFLPCCTYTTTGRRMLFGMPSSSSPSNCDAMC